MAEVLFASLRAERERSSFLKKFKIIGSKLNKEIKIRDLLVIKIHFSELGNHGFVGSVFTREIIDLVKEAGGKLFLTDSNILYKGSRSNTVDHLNTTIYYGFLCINGAYNNHC